MDRKIKTRQVHKDIKVLDKTVTVTDHVKQSYVRTKENIMQSTEKSSDRENNPVGYAEDAASKYADRIFHETGHQVRRQAGKIIERKKEKASVSSTGEETVYQPKEEIRPVPPSGGETAQEQGKELAVKKIKTIERDKRTIKRRLLIVIFVVPPQSKEFNKSIYSRNMVSLSTLLATA